MKIYSKVTVVLQVIGMLVLMYYSFASSFYVSISSFVKSLMLICGFEIISTVFFLILITILTVVQKDFVEKFKKASSLLFSVVKGMEILPTWANILVSPWLLGIVYAPFLGDKITVFNAIVAVVLSTFIVLPNFYIHRNQFKDICFSMPFFLIIFLFAITRFLFVFLIGLYVLSESIVSVIISFWILNIFRSLRSLKKRVVT